jgi:hypothetical protein
LFCEVWLIKVLLIKCRLYCNIPFRLIRFISACIEQVLDEQSARSASASLSHPFLDHPEGSDAPQIVKRLARYLKQVSEEPSSLPQPATDVFTSVKPPPISIEAYTQRLYQYMQCSPVCFAYAYVFMQGLVKENIVNIATATVHRCGSAKSVLQQSIISCFHFLICEIVHEAHYAWKLHFL